jgi:pimeloyl-ACP methyl ester carboxylesterase
VQLSATTDHFFSIEDSLSKRRLAYTDVGEKNSDILLLCIPGLLETRETFSNLIIKIDADHKFRAVSVDLCGRGDSDPLGESQNYSMRLYFKDLELLLENLLSNHISKSPQIHLIGTSMGGLLALYLASMGKRPISGVILNDVGFSLAWWSIYKLYGKMSKGSKMTSVKPVMDLEQLASELKVNTRVIQAVQDPSHFDLPFKSDMMGMRFNDLIKKMRHPVSLIHASESVICTALQVDEFLKYYPRSQLLEVPKAHHPAPYEDRVCEFVISRVAAPKLQAHGSSSADLKDLSALISDHNDQPEVVDSLNQAISLEPFTQPVTSPFAEQLTLPLFAALDSGIVTDSMEKISEINQEMFAQFTHSAEQLAGGLTDVPGQSSKPEINSKVTVEEVFKSDSLNQKTAPATLNTKSEFSISGEGLLFKLKTSLSQFFKLKG